MSSPGNLSHCPGHTHHFPLPWDPVPSCAHIKCSHAPICLLHFLTHTLRCGEDCDYASPSPAPSSELNTLNVHCANLLST